MLFMASLVGHVTSVDRLITQARAGLFSDAYTNVDIDAFEDEVMRHSWMMTASLGINVRQACHLFTSPESSLTRSTIPRS